MLDVETVAEFFNNQAVGAFLGAFSAFLLVTANDSRRERRGSAKTLGGSMDNAQRMKTAADLLATWGDMVGNLNRLIEMCDAYLAGHFKDLVAKQYNAADYEES